jgi:hypothetical protein
MLRGDLERARFENLELRVRQTVAEGNAAVAREQGRRIPDLAFHYWLDERLARFDADLEWSRQLTYLAMRAVEWELQASLGLRDEVLRATHPDQLGDVLRTLQQERLSRTINGRRPDGSQVVLSLRDDVLGLTPRAAAQPGDRAWTARERFQHRLWSPAYAVYADDGSYLGQGIPFALAEQGELELRCAERLWRVTATVQGDLAGEAAPDLPLVLVQRNSFASQWCSGRGDGSPHQVGAMLPPSQLFHPDDHGGSEAAGLASVAAMLHPYFNVPRHDFHGDGYTQGSSEELAGRGLYADYVLLFPWKGLLEHGFALEQVEDVLLRFDYESVDDLGGL